MNASISEINLKHPSSGEAVNTYGSDLRLEQDAGATGNFYICGAAYGGMTYDELTMSIAGANLTYDYKGNNQVQAYRFFTNDNPEGVVRSYMSVVYHQVCQ